MSTIAPASHAPLPLGVSIVLYKTPLAAILPLIQQLLEQGAAKIYLVDNSPPAFDTFRGWKPDARIETVRTGRNLGYGAGHNRAIRNSIERFQYHLVCNPDIVLGENALTRLCGLMNERQDVGLCMPKVLSPDGSMQYLCKRPPRPADVLIRRFLPRRWFAARHAWYEMRDQSYEQEREVEILSGCFMFFRSSVLRTLNGFDERFFLYFEDFDISRRAALAAHNLYWPKVHVTHAHARGHGKSLRLLAIALVSTVRYFNKWGWLQRAR